MIHTTSQSLRPQLDIILPRVEKPSRYIGSELFAEHPNFDATAEQLDVALMYPDIYDIGASNQALVILYDVARRLEGVGVERSFLPWIDMAAKLRKHEVPLFSLESQRPLKDFDVLGITLPHELIATNLCELFDLSGISFESSKRQEAAPIVLGGGPVAFNVAPFAAFFDAVCIGEGEEAFEEALLVLRDAKKEGLCRAERLARLADIEGYYVPTLKQESVSRRVLTDFANYPAVTNPIVPFLETSQDRLSVEILRGCTRGCRFCAAGMLSRPVRERSANVVVAAATQGLSRTGLSEVSLSSLSSTDHSQISQILRRLQNRYEDTDIKVNLPSQRLDAFGVSMAAVVCGSQKKGSLTFAPEAGTQRLRDVINKNVTEEDMMTAIKAAYEAGWRRAKLYFMLGLPTERDEDVLAIVELANKAYDAAKDAVPNNERGKVRMSISVAVFVPKAHTPFQFCGQVARAELERRVSLLKKARLHKGIDLRWHDPSASMIEAVYSRGNESLFALGIQAWKQGARFDAWSDQFDLRRWEEAASQLDINLQELAAKPLELDEPVPWDFITGGVSREFLVREYQRSIGVASVGEAASGGGAVSAQEAPSAQEAASRQEVPSAQGASSRQEVPSAQGASRLTPDCTMGACSQCGVCTDEIKSDVVGSRG